jgi:TATA-binding protein-associated factor
MGALYPRSSLKAKIPSFNSLEEWQEKKSTKIDICAHMCLHLLSRDDAAPMIFKDGGVIFPEAPQPTPGEVISRNNKILIYQEFPSFGPLVRQVFKLYGIPHLHIDGQTSYDDRAKIVSKFVTGSSFRVLFFSSVGATGLNLSAANTVIFLVCPLSTMAKIKF